MCLNKIMMQCNLHIQTGYSVTKINQHYLPLSYQSHLVLLLNKSKQQKSLTFNSSMHKSIFTAM